MENLLPQILLIAVSAAAIAAGVEKFLAGYGWAILINVLWAFYHICVLSMVFYFNRTFKPHERKPVYIQTH